MTAPTNANGLLLDLTRAVGKIEGQTEQILEEQTRAAEARKEQAESLALVTAKLETVTAAVAALQPDVAKMKSFRAQVAVAGTIIWLVVTGAINLVWYGFTHMDEIKAAMRELVR